MAGVVTFPVWKERAKAYAKAMWFIDDLEVYFDDDAMEADYDSGVSAKDFVDNWASGLDLDNYPAINWGNSPPGYVKTFYDVRGPN
jgi:hypothetical protein